MTDTPTVATQPKPGPGLLSRVVGIVLSPRDTMAAVAETPKWFGVMALTIVIIAGATGWFYSTQVGRLAALDQAEQSMRVFSSLMSEQQMSEARRQMEDTYRNGSLMRVAGWPIVAVVIVSPIMALVIAGLVKLIFGVAMGGTATFKQVFAVVAHSYVVSMVAVLVVTPLNYVRESLNSATTLRIFVPMLDDTNFLARLLGHIDLMTLWWILVLSTGIAVLYKRKTTGVAISLVAVYGVIAIGTAAIAAMFAARS
jgi:hypothetical protein